MPRATDLQQSPQARRCQRHLQLRRVVAMAMTGQGIRHGIDHTRSGANGAELANTFDTQRVVQAGG